MNNPYNRDSDRDRELLASALEKQRLMLERLELSRKNPKSHTENHNNNCNENSGKAPPVTDSKLYDMEITIGDNSYSQQYAFQKNVDGTNSSSRLFPASSPGCYASIANRYDEAEEIRQHHNLAFEQQQRVLNQVKANRMKYNNPLAQDNTARLAVQQYQCDLPVVAVPTSVLVPASVSHMDSLSNSDDDDYYVDEQERARRRHELAMQQQQLILNQVQANRMREHRQSPSNYYCSTPGKPQKFSTSNISPKMILSKTTMLEHEDCRCSVTRTSSTSSRPKRPDNGGNTWSPEKHDKRSTNVAHSIPKQQQVREIEEEQQKRILLQVEASRASRQPKNRRTNGNKKRNSSPGKQEKSSTKVVQCMPKQQGREIEGQQQKRIQPQVEASRASGQPKNRRQNGNKRKGSSSKKMN